MGRLFTIACCSLFTISFVGMLSAASTSPVTTTANAPLGSSKSSSPTVATKNSASTSVASISSSTPVSPNTKTSPSEPTASSQSATSASANSSPSSTVKTPTTSSEISTHTANTASSKTASPANTSVTHTGTSTHNANTASSNTPSSPATTTAASSKSVSASSSSSSISPISKSSLSSNSVTTTLKTSPTSSESTTPTASAQSSPSSSPPTAVSHSISTTTVAVHTTTINLTNVDLCTTNPTEACHLIGPFECSKNDDEYHCGCATGYFDNKHHCIVESSFDGRLFFENATAADLNSTAITSELNSLLGSIPTYLHSEVTGGTDGDSENVKSQIFADTDGATARIKIFLKELNATLDDQIADTLTNYTETCLTSCFGINSPVNYTALNASGPCDTTIRLCENYPGTDCKNTVDRPDVQFQCVCHGSAPSNVSYIANGGEIFVCPITPISHNCDSNPCSNGGDCAPVLDGYRCSCPWTYIGKNCTNPLPLAMVILSCILGALTLLLIAALIYTFIKNKKKTSRVDVQNETRWETGPQYGSSTPAKTNQAYEDHENIGLVGKKNKDVNIRGTKYTEQSHF